MATDGATASENSNAQPHNDFDTANPCWYGGPRRRGGGRGIDGLHPATALLQRKEEGISASSGRNRVKDVRVGADFERWFSDPHVPRSVHFVERIFQECLYMELTKPFSRNLSRLREERGLTISGLSERCGIARSALVSLEAGVGDPSIESLWAIANVLDAPFGSLLDAGPEGVRGLGDETAHIRLMDRKEGRGGETIELYSMSLAPGSAKESLAHPPGVKEKVVVINGPIQVGDKRSPQWLRTGDVYAFDGDVPHVYAAPDGCAQAMILLHYPAVPGPDALHPTTLDWPVDAVGWEGVRSSVERMCIDVANGVQSRILRFRALPETSSLTALKELKDEVMHSPARGFRWPVLAFVETDQVGPFLAVLPQRYPCAFQSTCMAPEDAPLAKRAMELARLSESGLSAGRETAIADGEVGNGWTLEALLCECELQAGRLRLPSQLQGMAERTHSEVATSHADQAFSSRIQVDHYDAYELLHPAYARQVVAMAQDIATFIPEALQTTLRTIDVGTGPGVPLLMLRELLPQLRPLAVEPDPVAFACLEINIRGQSGIQLHQGGFLELEHPEGQSALITSVGSSHHFNTAFMLQKAYRLLQPGGVLSVADEFLPPYHDLASRNLALVLHHSAYILEAAALIERGGHPVPSDEDGRLYRAFRAHLVPAVIHAQERDALQAERLCRKLFSIASQTGLDKASSSSIGAYTRFFWLELQAMVAGFDYEVERKTHVRRFLELSEASGFELLSHRRIFATSGAGDRDGGTHVITLRKCVSWKRPDFHALSAGLRSSLSVGVGYLPIAFSFGVAAVQAGLSPAVAMLVSMVVYAGASQFLLISLLASGAGLVTAVPAVMLMNVRHALYGPALVAGGSHRHSRLPSPWLSFGLTDEVFATAMSKISSVPPHHRDHWLVGLQVGAYVAWVAGTAIGVMFVRDVESWPAAVREGLGFVLPALFFALLLETGLRRWRLPVTVAAGVSALLGVFMASHHALALAVLAGALSHALFSRLPR